MQHSLETIMQAITCCLLATNDCKEATDVALCYMLSLTMKTAFCIESGIVAEDA